MYAALYLPRLRLQAALAFPSADSNQQTGNENACVAIADKDAKKPIVLDMTLPAEREGVVPGLSIPQAIGRCPALEVRHRSEQAEIALGEALFHAAYSLSPRVEQTSNDLALVDLRGVNFKKGQARCLEIKQELAARGLAFLVGIAPSCTLAILAAKRATGLLIVCNETLVTPSQDVSSLSRSSFLNDLPIAATEPAEALLGILDKWGIRTVGEYAQLKRDSVGARLGQEGLLLWDRVNGNEKTVIGVADLPAVFEESWEFEYDVDSLEPLFFILRRFLDQLCLKLKMANKVAVSIRAELGLAYGEPISIVQKLPEPNSHADSLFPLLAGQLETLDTDSPVSRFSLSIEPVDYQQRQMGLFESSLINPSRFMQTLSRVAGIIGSDNVGRVVLEEDGRPDGFRLEEFARSMQPSEKTCLDSHYGLPLRRFRPRRAASVTSRERQIVWVRSSPAMGPVKACRGPWLHSGHWWESEKTWSRVEWDVELDQGGIYRLVREKNGWFLEGQYD